MASKTFRAPNISCDHCVRTIEREVGELPGVRSVKADAASKIVTIEWQEPATDWETIRSLLVEINYPPEGA